MSIKYLADRFGQETVEITREEEMEANTDLLVFIRLMDREGQRSFSGRLSSFAVLISHLNQALLRKMEV
ncbi:MAG TPA: hypothetical protein VI584_06635 [Nitrospiria bacterium]|nr:hypothetical protein [Nitrospiria bacterium]